MSRFTACVLLTLCFQQQLCAAVIYNVNFSDGAIPSGAFVIDDSGNGVNVVPAAGDLTDMPLLLSGTAADLATVAFYHPQFSQGRYVYSWDSLVLSHQLEDKDIFGRDQSFVHLLASDQGHAVVPWSLEYDVTGEMQLGCCNNSVPVSSTPVGSYLRPS